MERAPPASPSAARAAAAAWAPPSPALAHLRAALRLLAFVTWSLPAGLVGLLCLGLATLAPDAGRRAHRALARLWARVTAALVGLRVRVHGTPPSPPFFLVSNHCGYLDIITLMAHAPGIFVSRADLAGWPLLGPLSRVACTIFIERERRSDVLRVNEQVAAVLASGRGVLVFPEGTSSDGAQVLPFRSPLLESAVAAGRPVSWASLRYRTPPGWPPASLAVCWWGDMTFPDHFWRLLGLPAIEADLHFGQLPLEGRDRRALASALRDAVAGPLPAQPPP